MKRLLLGLGAFILAISSVTFLPPLPVFAQEAPDDGSICAANPDAPLDIVLTLDKSGSIKSVDPERKRFESTDAFIDGLVDIAGSGKEIAINVIFFNTEAQSSGWNNVAPESAADIKQVIRTGWEKPTGDTDHVKAFEESYDALEGRDDRCRIVVMFTDGIMDTGSGNATSDVERALGQSQPCTPLNNATLPPADGQTVSQQANDLGVTTFVLLLNPARGADNFQERLNATMTLFSAVTGDLDPPTVSENYELQCKTDLDGQSGEIFGAGDINKVLARFYAIEDDIGGGQPGVELCPAPFDGGTVPLPAGALIDRLTIIDFDATDEPGSLNDFTIETPDGATFPASTALEGETTSPVRWKLTVSNPDLLPGGWILKSPDTGSYCVNLFEQMNLAATLTTETGVIRLQDVDGSETLGVDYSPAGAGGQIELTVDFGGVAATTDSGLIDINIPVAWAEDTDPPGTGLPEATGTGDALGTELFQDMPVNITVDPTQILDRTSDIYPKVICKESSLTLLEGDAPRSGSIDSVDTTCEVKPGTDSGGETTFLTYNSVTDNTGSTDGASSPNVQFTLVSDGDETPLVEDIPVEVTDLGAIWVSTDGIENERILIEEVATFTLSYEETPGVVGERFDDSIALTIDLKARANRVVATIVTILLMLLFAIASMLLLWAFNRLTARLPDASKFYFQTLKADAASSKDNGRDLKPAQSMNHSLRFGDVGIRLDHPPVWKPLSDSVGVIHGPGFPAADPTGPTARTVPLGFSTLLIGIRSAEGETEYLAVVPRTGPGAGIDGVRTLSSDPSRRQRVADRLDRDYPEDVEGQSPQGEGSSKDPLASPHTGTPTESETPDRMPDDTPPQSGAAGPSGPRLPGG